MVFTNYYEKSFKVSYGIDKILYSQLKRIKNQEELNGNIVLKNNNCSSWELFKGVFGGVTNGSTVIVRFGENPMKADKYNIEDDNEIDNSYLPMIIIMLHQKYAVMNFLTKMNKPDGDQKNLSDQIVLFKQKLMIPRISDNKEIQDFYDSLLKLNAVKSMLNENMPKFEYLLNSYSEIKHVGMERATGLISIVFAIIGMFSIFNDGMQIIDRLFP